MRGLDALWTYSLVQSLIIANFERKAEKRESFGLQLDGCGLENKSELAKTL